MDPIAMLSVITAPNRIAESYDSIRLRQAGWIESSVRCPFGAFDEQVEWKTKTAAWVHVNAVGNYKYLGRSWFFEKPSDATAFTLRWA